MNIYEMDILNSLRATGYQNQRMLAELTGYSVGAVNSALKNLAEMEYIRSDFSLSDKAENFFKKSAPKNAVILAAGYGMRMVPINKECPKAFVEVKGEKLIERQINQLIAAGITKIYIVVGFMKEQFDYLIDKYGVELIVNPDYSTKNNLHSLSLALQYIGKTYIVPCDIWCEENPFSRFELYSWYMLGNKKTPLSAVRVNRKCRIVPVLDEDDGNTMVGISYICGDTAEKLKKNLALFDKDRRYNNAFWEDALFADRDTDVYARLISQEKAVEINTYEQLREFDSGSKHLKNKTIETAAEALKVNSEDIKNIEVLKKGMTNNSFLFENNGTKYIMRIPGEGTDMLINRKEEASVYAALSGRKICDDVVYINPENGYKITVFLQNARVCNADNPEDVSKCMDFLRRFHNQKLEVSHFFDIFEKIEYYEKLWGGLPSEFVDYKETKEKIFSLKKFIDDNTNEYCLTHIDAVPDNFLFYKEKDGKEKIRLIDWEYAAMQDPNVDIAMFAVYAMYSEEKIEALIDSYYKEGCSEKTRAKIYCYIAACGLLWSNWCEYKRLFGIEFGEYSLKQYRFAKDYYKIAKEYIDD